MNKNKETEVDVVGIDSRATDKKIIIGVIIAIIFAVPAMKGTGDVVLACLSLAGALYSLYSIQGYLDACEEASEISRLEEAGFMQVDPDKMDYGW